jgi:hypothetical protein
VQVEVNPHWFTSLHLVFIVRNEKGSDVREDKISKLPGIGRNVSTVIITRNIVGCCEFLSIDLDSHLFNTGISEIPATMTKQSQFTKKIILQK